MVRTVILAIAVLFSLGFYLGKKVPAADLEPLYISPPLELVKLSCLNMRAAAADIFFLQTIYHITDDKHPRGKWNLDWIYKNLDLAVNLDRGFSSAFFLGAMIIPGEEKTFKLAVSFLEKNLDKTNDWRIPFWLGFNYLQLRDFNAAGRYFDRASELPGAPGYLAGMRVMSYYQAGNSRMSLAVLNFLLESASEKDQGWIKIKIEWLENIAYLEEAVEKFKQRFGRWPEDLNELPRGGIIGSIPKDPWLGGYYLDAKNKKVVSRLRPD